ncbi:4-hydroxy-tetrahydrodipicolinate reductase [Candidatus Annandia adelgestsuga]|uniref:4-hydroxy-tetrahydrodipicolinate reductase n=1 Tax=Candidatus Annandia adelgestsuga TaxID=1302411 RepID=A0A3S9J7I6_9ENTR|nr:4-hydroxy-tetrahydrodipicolinate reductase [Candidatus Annandia adelgestsuga]AZP36250.1 4-hydroxy-tetrahydrodipicolinate reductase [Candidatus Annandia adelgestsuga]
MSSKIKIAISGAYGKMGKSIINTIYKIKNVKLTALLINKNKIIPNNIDKKKIKNVKISNNFNDIYNIFDILIDFTCPKSTIEYLYLCHKYNKKIIIGTTGFNNSEKEKIKKFSNKIAILLSSNFSIGINLILNILEKITKSIGNDNDIEIIEYHHRNKKDAPSGTALTIGKTIAKSMKLKLNECAIYDKNINRNKIKNSIGFSVIRAGDIIGDHTIIFANKGERIEITHKASNRITFAKGAIKASIWLYKKKRGLFSMKDVLKFKN